jgi:soluble lytic murein transglycosylase-like protein
MTKQRAALLGIVLVGLALLLWKRNAVVEGVLTVYYATTQDSKANEEKYSAYIAAAEARNGIPAGLFHRELWQESRFRSDLIGIYPDGTPVPDDQRGKSGAGAQGIAQIVPRWHPGVDTWNPYASIDYGAGYLASLYRQFGSWDKALAAYNWGPSNLQRHLAANGGQLNLAELPEETRNYVEQITTDAGVA